MARLHLRWMLVGVAALGLGCGSSEEAPRTEVFPVTGQIFVNGKPPENALVYLHPAKPIPNAPRPRAVVQKDGSITFTTYEQHDGAPEGDYVLLVSWREPPKGDEYVKAEDRDEGKELLPAIYQDPNLSGLRVKVNRGENKLDGIQITR